MVMMRSLKESTKTIKSKATLDANVKAKVEESRARSAALKYPVLLRHIILGFKTHDDPTLQSPPA